MVLKPGYLQMLARMSLFQIFQILRIYFDLQLLEPIPRGQTDRIAPRRVARSPYRYCIGSSSYTAC
jgi:hypothetical protein